MQTKQIREHMEVVGADEEHVGTSTASMAGKSS